PGTRYLYEEIGSLGAAMEIPRLGQRGVGVVGQPRGDLERHPAIDPGGALVYGPEQIRGAGQVLERELEEELLVRQPRLCEVADIGVVGRDMLHRMIEDRRVGSEPGDRQLVDVALQGTARKQVPRDVVQPQALAGAVELQCIGAWPRPCATPFGPAFAVQNLSSRFSHLELLRQISARRRRSAAPLRRWSQDGVRCGSSRRKSCISSRFPTDGPRSEE